MLMLARLWLFLLLYIKMRLLNGSELAGYIKERQAKQVRNLRQSWATIPRLAIVVVGDSDVVNTYVRLKRVYGEDILIEVDVHSVEQSEAANLLTSLSDNELVHGIILQLPVSDPSKTDELISCIAPEKDVDGLGAGSPYVSATATAIDWLVAGYNVTLRDKHIVIVGNGRLVGSPLASLWKNAGHNVTVCDENTSDLAAETLNADIIVTATGVPGLINSSMVRHKAVVVDAGTASENGVLVGDVSADVRERDDLTITPARGGVGPLTIAALFDNVITAARRVADSKKGQ